MFEYEERDGRAVEDETQKQQQEQEQEQRGEDSVLLSGEGGAADGEVFEFRLFASEAGLARVRIRSPTPAGREGEEGGFVVPVRPRSYYFTFSGDGDGEGWKRRRDEYADVAVEGHDVLSMAGCTAWVRQTASFRLPICAERMMANGRLDSQVLRCHGEWCGSRLPVW